LKEQRMTRNLVPEMLDRRALHRKLATRRNHIVAREYLEPTSRPSPRATRAIASPMSMNESSGNFSRDSAGGSWRRQDSGADISSAAERPHSMIRQQNPD